MKIIKRFRDSKYVHKTESD